MKIKTVLVEMDTELVDGRELMARAMVRVSLSTAATIVANDSTRRSRIVPGTTREDLLGTDLKNEALLFPVAFHDGELWRIADGVHGEHFTQNGNYVCPTSIASLVVELGEVAEGNLEVSR